jgi:hypothetical protein
MIHFDAVTLWTFTRGRIKSSLLTYSEYPIELNEGDPGRGRWASLAQADNHIRARPIRTPDERETFS